MLSPKPCSSCPPIKYERAINGAHGTVVSKLLNYMYTVTYSTGHTVYRYRFDEIESTSISAQSHC